MSSNRVEELVREVISAVLANTRAKAGEVLHCDLTEAQDAVRKVLRTAISPDGVEERVARAIANEQWDQSVTALGTPNYVRGGDWPSWLPHAREAIAAIAATSAEGDERIDPTPRCPHGIRRPWQCDDCDRENPIPEGWSPTLGQATQKE